LIRPPVPSATLLPTSGLAPRRAVDQPGWLTSSRTPNLRNRMVDVETNIVDFWPRELHFPSRSLEMPSLILAAGKFVEFIR